MATATDTVVEGEAAVEATAATQKRKRSKKASFLEDRGIDSLGSCPAIPDEFVPALFLTLKDDDFDDLLDAKQHEANVLSYNLSLVNEEIQRLKNVPEESRADYAKTQDHLATALAYIRKMQKSGADVSPFLAEVQAAMAGSGE